MTAAEVLGATVEALAHADAQELARLAEAAREAAAPETPAERRSVVERHRALGRLLQLTRRNLWLLRGVYREPCGYGARRD
jgi:hypothetical protein